MREQIRIKNVVVVCDYAYVEGGAANVAIQTAIALSKYSDLHVYFLAGCGEPCDELKENSVETISLGMPDLLGNPSRIQAMVNGIYNWTAYHRICSFLDTLDFKNTVINIHSWTKVLSSAVFRAAEKRDIPVYLTVHDYFLVCPNGGCYNYVSNKICDSKPLSISCLLCNCDVRNYFHKIWRCVRQIVQNQVIRGSSNINYIFISEFEKKQILERMQEPQKHTMLKNPIVCEQRYRVFAENNELFVFIGRVSEEKGIKLFCESARKARVKAVVIGDGKLRDQLQKEYYEITFTGWLQKNEIRKWIDKTRCLVFPSLWYEGSPLTIPEVQAYGIPCIVTDCSAATDTIADSVNGLIVDSSADSIVNAINCMKSDYLVKVLSQNTFDFFDVSRCDEMLYSEKLLRIINT